MKKIKRNVKVVWLGPRVGEAPDLLLYNAISSFRSRLENGKITRWTIDIEFDQKPRKNDLVSYGLASFRAYDKAPQSSLKKDVVFTLTEGFDDTAEVTVLDNYDGLDEDE